jgi:DNA-binding SARP family transcriptional activator/TolB-like protein
MPLVLELLGGFRLRGADGNPLHLPGRGRALLALLALSSSPMTRDLLARRLCSDGCEQDQRKELRQTLYAVRRTAGEFAVCVGEDGCLGLSHAEVSADVLGFRAAISAGDTCSLERAVALYKGAFLDGEQSPTPEFEDWLQERRAEFLEETVRALLELARSDIAASASRRALDRARHALTLDPLCEVAHRIVMTTMSALGERSSALRHYEETRRLLGEELGVEPEEETERLYDRVASGGSGVTIENPPPPEGVQEQSVPLRLRWRSATVALVLLSSIPISLILLGYLLRAHPTSTTAVPSLAVLPFRNESGDPAQNALGYGIAEDIVIRLASHPALNVVSRSRTFRLDPKTDIGVVGEKTGAAYVLEGTARHSAGAVEVTAQLTDTATGLHLWSRRYEGAVPDTGLIKQQIANDISESLVGFTGEIGNEEQRKAWLGTTAELAEQDYFRRGEQFYFQFTADSHIRAKRVWEDGLQHFPDSIRLRLGLAAAYRHAVEVGWSIDAPHELSEACRLGKEAGLLPTRSRYEQWLFHWLTAKLAQWCDADFPRSVMEAEKADRMAPYDATARADLAELLANAGRTEQAIEWLEDAMLRDPKPPDWYLGNLGWALYLNGQFEESLQALQKQRMPNLLIMAAVQVRLGIAVDAQLTVSRFIESNPAYNPANLQLKPLVEPLKAAWLDDLRKAGLEATQF